MRRERRISGPTVIVAVAASLAASYGMQRLNRRAETDPRRGTASPAAESSRAAGPRRADHGQSAPVENPSRVAREPSPRLAEPGAQAPSMPSYEEMFAEDMRLNAMRVSTVTEQLRAEGRDPEWASRMEVLLEAATSELLSGNGRLIRLECRSTLCSVRAEHHSEESQADFIATLPMRVFRDLDGAFMARFAGEGGGLETHGFFARNGHSVPIPEVQ